MAYQVLVRYPNGQQLDFQFDKDVVVIGRVDGCDVRLAHTFVSSRHVRIQRQAGRFYVQDLGSTNGTLINGTQLEPRVPQAFGSGDKIQLGSLEILVEPIVDATVIEKTPPAAAAAATSNYSADDGKTLNEPGGLPRPRPVSADIPIDEPAPMWQLQTGMMDLKSAVMRIDDQVVSPPRGEVVSSSRRPDFEASLRARRVALEPVADDSGPGIVPFGMIVQALGAILVLGGLAVLVAIMVL